MSWGWLQPSYASGIPHTWEQDFPWLHSPFVDPYRLIIVKPNPDFILPLDGFRPGQVDSFLP
jgi:hypothetical protein